MVNGDFKDYAYKAGTKTYTPPNDTRVARTLADRLWVRVNVKDWGATGNGVTDDTDAIVAAIAYAAQFHQSPYTQGAVVFFPAGVYIISKGGTVPIWFDGAYFEGAGRDVSILRGNFDPAGNQQEEANNSWLVQSGGGVIGISNLTIHNQSVGVTSGAIFFHTWGNCGFAENCHFIGYSGFAACETAFGYRVTDCLFTCSKPPTVASDANRSPWYRPDKIREPGGGSFEISMANNPTGGAIQLVNNGITSALIPWNGTAAQVKTAVEGMGFTVASCTGGPFPNAFIKVVLANADTVDYPPFTSNNGLQPPGVPSLIVANKSNFRASIGAIMGQGYYVNCRAVGFDVGFSSTNGSFIGWTVSRCGIGMVCALKNGARQGIGGLDAHVYSAQWYTTYFGETTACNFDRCTWGVYAFNMKQEFLSNNFTGATGPTDPAPIASMSRITTAPYTVTVTTSVPHNLPAGNPTIQILNIASLAPLSGWTVDTNAGFVTATIIDSTHFSYPGPSVAPPAYTSGGGWNYPMEYGFNMGTYGPAGIQGSGDCTFISNNISGKYSVAAVWASGAVNNGRNIMWCTRGEYGWILPAPDFLPYSASCWTFEQCGINVGTTRPGTVSFPGVPNTKYMPLLQENFPGFSSIGDEIGITSGDAGLTFGDSAYSFFYLSAAAPIGTTVLQFASLPTNGAIAPGMNCMVLDSFRGLDASQHVVSSNSTSVTISPPSSRGDMVLGQRIAFFRTAAPGKSPNGTTHYKLRYDGQAWRVVA